MFLVNGHTLALKQGAFIGLDAYLAAGGECQRDLFSDDAAIEPRAEAVEVRGLAVDSRAVKPGDLFFALAGSKTDGSRFIDAAIASIEKLQFAEGAGGGGA